VTLCSLAGTRLREVSFSLRVLKVVSMASLRNGSLGAWWGEPLRPPFVISLMALGKKIPTKLRIVERLGRFLMLKEAQDADAVQWKTSLFVRICSLFGALDGEAIICIWVKLFSLV